MKIKFGFPDAAELVFDETNREVEEDIFSELIDTNPELCLTVRDKLSYAGLFHYKICRNYSSGWA